MPHRLFIIWMLQGLLFFTVPAYAIEKADSVMVYKSQRTLHLMKDGQVIAAFPVVFGADPVGHKQKMGDEKTPEGRYVLDYKNSNSAFYKSIHISYPNAKDRRQAKRLGVNPGGDIMIHGQSNGYGWASPIARFFNWTDGCIALNDLDMQQVWESVDSGTKIEIFP